MYFTSSQSSTHKWLGTSEDAYEMIANWGRRLRKAMGEEEILSRYHYIGGEFRVPTFRAMAEALNRSPWSLYGQYGRTLYVVPYNDLYDGWTKNPQRHSGGFMCNCVSPYEYAYEFFMAHDDPMYLSEHRSAFQIDYEMEDIETKNIWLNYLPENHVVKGNFKDNFWMMADVGPCGVCTEIHYNNYESSGDAEDVDDIKELATLYDNEHLKELHKHLSLRDASGFIKA